MRRSFNSNYRESGSGGGVKIWQGGMKAPVAFPNTYSLLDLLPSQARERVAELLAIAHQRPPPQL